MFKSSHPDQFFLNVNRLRLVDPTTDFLRVRLCENCETCDA